MAKKNRYKKPENLQRRDVSLVWRVGARIFSVAALFVTVLYGMTAGGHIKNPDNFLYNFQGKVAAPFGYAAREIRIAGLKRHKPTAVLQAIGVLPNGSLIGFNPSMARAVLENVDWVKKAEIKRIYPNQLEIDIVERLPFAIWQRDGEFYVVDKNGSAFTSIEASDVRGLIVVTGEGAHKKVFDLVNHLEAHSGLKSKIAAAGRIGGRRWNLYLKSGMKVMLPEHNIASSLERLDRLAKDTGVYDKAVASVDLRIVDRVVITPIKDDKKRVELSQM